MTRCIFSLFALVLLGVSCGGSAARRVQPSGEITEGKARTVKLQPDEVSQKGTSAGSEKTSNPSETPSRTSQDEKLSPQARALLEEMKKQQRQSDSAWEKKLKEVEDELQGKSISAADLQKADACVAEGNRLLAQSSYEQAAQKYSEALDHCPLHEEAREKLIECHRIMRMPEGEKESEDLAPAQERILLRQKFAAGEQLFAEKSLNEAAAKFREVIDMITWSKKKLDTQNYLQRAREYLEKIEANKKESAQPDSQEKTPQK